jgi:hypothetical protein
MVLLHFFRKILITKFFILFFIFFTFNLKSSEQFYRFNPHHGEFTRELKKYFLPVYNKGRMQIYRKKKSFSEKEIPKNLLNHLLKIKKNGWKIIRPHQLQQTSIPSPSILSKISEISASNILDHLKLMTEKESRLAGSLGNKEITRYVETFLKNYNFKTTKSCFLPNICNIWGSIPGEIDEYILIEAHLDSVGKLYSGADDNASGMASLLELARILSSKKYKRGLIIFATNGEESGLLGSKHFVKEAQISGLLSKISFFINMDMIGWNENGIVDIETDHQFENHARWMSTLVNTYTPLKPEITMPAWGSDHVPFLRKGIPGILTIKHWKTKTPCYHKRCDTLDTLNISYLIEISKLNLAAAISKLNQ